MFEDALPTAQVVTMGRSGPTVSRQYLTLTKYVKNRFRIYKRMIGRSHQGKAATPAVVTGFGNSVEDLGVTSGA